MKRTIRYAAFWPIVSFCALALAGCFDFSGSGQASGSFSLGDFSCTAAGTLASGQTLSASSSVTLSSLLVTLTGETTGDTFHLTFPDGTTATTTSASYTDTSPVTVSTDASGTVTGQVSVADQQSGATASCTVTTGQSTTSSDSIEVDASPAANVSAGGSIQISLTSPVASEGTYFLVESGDVPLIYTPISSTSMQLTADPHYSGTFDLNVYQYDATDNSQVAQGTISLSFGSSAYSGQVALSASTPWAPVGASITLTPWVSQINDASFTYAQVFDGPFFGPLSTYHHQGWGYCSAALTITTNSDGTALVSARQPGHYVIEVSATGDDPSQSASTEIEVDFTP